MNRKQRERKRRKAQEHSEQQYQKRLTATRETIAELNKSKKPISMANMSDEMEARGYVSDGYGGWRPINKPKKIDKITKES